MQTYIVPASGKGRRMGLKVPKQFIDYLGKPLIIHTLEKLEEADSIDRIIVTTDKTNLSYMKSLIEKYQLKKVSDIIIGGKERQHSIELALERCSPEEIIGVHDAVRPFVEVEVIEGCYKLLSESSNIHGVVVGVPVKDTIKKVGSEGFITETPVRSELLAAQTPQVFRGAILKKAYTEARKTGFLGTDDSSLVERIGGRVKVVEGSYQNVKITTVEDLNLLNKED